MTYEIISVRKRKTVPIRNPSDVYNTVKRYTKSDQEYFLVITLNGSHDIIAVHISTIGLVNKTVVHPREVFKWAIRDNASSIIVCHNHPSDIVKPSDEDKAITERLKEAAEIIGINFLDHIIIGKSEYYSFRKMGLIE
jgi:DNA repair protein RadC